MHSHTLESALKSGQGARMVQIDFNAAFVKVNHQGILYRLRSVGILVNVVLEVPQTSVLGPVFFSPVHLEANQIT